MKYTLDFIMHLNTFKPSFIELNGNSIGFEIYWSCE